MKSLITPEDMIMKESAVLHWWTYFHLCFGLTGVPDKRLRFVEKHLPLMCGAGLLKMVKQGKKHVYTSWSQPSHLGHGLVCTEALLKLRAANRDCEVIGENELRAGKYGVVGEFALLYRNRTMLICEYCTADNVGRLGLVTKKVNLYRPGLPRIEKHFDAITAVLFILDTKHTLRYAMRSLGASFAYFVDKETFFSVPLGKHLTAPIYIWGGDGKKYPLNADD